MNLARNDANRVYYCRKIVGNRMKHFYRKHLFFCTNLAVGGKKCCQQADAQSMRQCAKRIIKERGLAGKGNVRVSSSGCMGRCKDGPVLVVYPDGVWYTYADEGDMLEIIESHIEGGHVVKRLLINED